MADSCPSRFDKLLGYSVCTSYFSLGNLDFLGGREGVTSPVSVVYNLPIDRGCDGNSYNKSTCCEVHVGFFIKMINFL